MTKAYLFIQKLIALALNLLVFFLISDYIEVVYSLPVMLIVFSLIISKISGDSPKELYNYKRSEKYFAKGGLRDLLRIPVVLIAFIHNIFVWAIWGISQILQLVTDAIYFFKVILTAILNAIIWFLKQLVPFWRLAYYMFVFYIVKWPWWTYRYACQSVKRTFNWNIIKISLIGSLIALFIFQFFYFLDITLEISGLMFIGVVLALLPVSWAFGEISTVRGQKLLDASYIEVKIKFRNGLETVRGLLFFLTFFVVLIIAEAGLDLLGWLPNSGIMFLGFLININFIINILLIFLAILFLFGTLVLPTYRLYNDFNETSLKDVYDFISYLFRRVLQYLHGFIPSSFFAVITIIPSAILVGSALFITLVLKDNIIDEKINRLTKEQYSATTAADEYRYNKRKDELEFIKQFPWQILQEMKHRNLLKKEINDNSEKINNIQLNLAEYKDNLNYVATEIKRQIGEEQLRRFVNQTRVLELEAKLLELNEESEIYYKEKMFEIEKARINIEFLTRHYKQLPAVFYFSGLFMVVLCTIIFAFFIGFFGNFFYKSYKFHNDGTPAMWKEIIKGEKAINSRHPLLSITLNIVVITVLVLLIFFDPFGIL